MPKMYERKCDVCQKQYRNRNRYFCSRACLFISPVRNGKIRAANLLKSGANSSRWKGGVVDRSGYFFVREGKSYKAQHRIVMENAIGRKLKDRELVHHVDENKNNNGIENLILFRTKGAHNRLHRFAKRNNIPVALLDFRQSWLYS